MSTAANRGKWAEGKVRVYLQSLETAKLAFHRFPDAHAGSLVATPADFLVCRSARLTLLEVKEVQHEYRLNHKNFALDQMARMRMWKLAGAEAYVAVCFMPSKTWRILDVDYFVNREGASWDMRDIPTVPLSTLETLL